MSIRTKILLPMVIMTMICSLITGTIAVLVVNLFTSDFNDERLLSGKSIAVTLLNQRSTDAGRLSEMAAENEQLISGIADYNKSGDREKLTDAAVSLMNGTGADFLTVMDVEGNVLVRAHEPENFGDSLAEQANVKSAMGGKQYTTIEQGTSVKLSARSGTPIFDSGGDMIAIISLGYRFDQSGFVDYIKEVSGTEVSVYLGDTCISTTVSGDGGGRAVNIAAPASVSKAVLGGESYMGRLTTGEGSLYEHYSPISDANGVILGMLATGLDTSETDARIQRDTWITAGFMVFLCIASASVSLVVSTRIVRPISEMASAARRLAQGDVDVEVTVSPQKKSKDETLQLALAFSDMIGADRERAKVIGAVAGGDLSGNIVPSSDKDVVGLALIELLNRNNLSFGEMSAAAAQLDTASNQMADGAQELSSGAARQAETVDQLSARLKSLSEKTTEEANNAKQAAQMSEAVKVFAEKGSHQMEQMMDAVGQISKASEAIEKVIKVIDDIAFQTNILALNAAVEAARAGQHGKGFAVVAEEVRNLAAKSADAAKDTGGLIANSIEKAKLGAQISADTASSFAEIVNGVNNSTVIVETVAEFMQTQKTEIEGIARGVDEIRDVVMAVNASAQQSASASEEMRAQAAMMASTLSAYQLRD